MSYSRQLSFKDVGLNFRGHFKALMPCLLFCGHLYMPIICPLYCIRYIILALTSIGL